MGRAGRGRAPRPARSPSFVAEPGRGAETIDLLMCAASVGCASTVQALIDCGTLQARYCWRSLQEACRSSLRPGLHDCRFDAQQM